MLAARVGVLVVVAALASSCVNLSYPPDAGALVAQKAAGQTCKENRECQSAICSLDGVCCKTACDGPCMTCAKSGSEGVCMPADVGTNPRGMCMDMGASKCSDNGTCDGAGACAKYPPGTICGEAKCSRNVADLAPRCNATGECEAGAQKDCKPYACGADGNCLTMCTSLDDCANPNPCAADGTCGKKALGTACMAGGDCDSGNCSQGVCCDKACNVACMSCALKGSEGVCTAVPAGMPSPPMTGTCATSDVSTCGTDGKCDGAGHCRLYPSGTVCNPVMCSTATLRARNHPCTTSAPATPRKIPCRGGGR